MTQAIVTTYRNGRILAQSYGAKIRKDYDHALTAFQNHAEAARTLAERQQLPGRWYEGGMPDGKARVFVRINSDLSEPAFETVPNPSHIAK